MDVNAIYNMDALDFLQSLPDDSVHCIVTSPPYWGLRSYLDDEHPDKDMEIGLEDTLWEYLDKLTVIFREARRVLRGDGVMFVNMGDGYAAGSSNPSPKHSVNLVGRERKSANCGLKPKDLIGQPWRLAFRLQEDGWWLRSDIIWYKPNPLPESMKDRPTKSHEYVFLMTKSARYWYDAYAVMEPHKETSAMRYNYNFNAFNGGLKTGMITRKNPTANLEYNPAGRNKRTVWTIPTYSFPGAHYATFPPKLITPMILAGCPPKVCAVCGAPWERVVDRKKNYHAIRTDTGKPRNKAIVNMGGKSGSQDSDGYYLSDYYHTEVLHIGWQPTCDHNAETLPGIVLDMFAGSGTVGLVAIQHGRRYILNDLSAEYVEMAKRRLSKPIQVDMFTSHGL